MRHYAMLIEIELMSLSPTPEPLLRYINFDLPHFTPAESFALLSAPLLSFSTPPTHHLLFVFPS